MEHIPTTKVVSLKGDPIKAPGTPNENVIKVLEWALEAAKSGEVTGIAIVYNYHDSCTAHQHVGGISRSMLGAIEIMKTKMIRDLE